MGSSVTYWRQQLKHIYIHIYVSCFAGVYKPEPMRDMWWALLSNGIMFLYHFVFLQLLGLVRWSPLLASMWYIKYLVTDVTTFISLQNNI